MTRAADDLPAGLRLLCERATSAAIFLDYDGTLAPIVADPAGAAPLPGVADVLERLASRYALVAVVSGRPVSYLIDALGEGAVALVGLYGFESRDPSGAVHGSPEAEAWRQVVTDAIGRALQPEPLALDPAPAAMPEGVELEAKGLTFTLHWRANPDGAGWARAFAAAEQDRSGLISQEGRMAIELRPPVNTDKGTVVATLAGDHDPLAYFGDDLGDLPAFEALGRLALEGRTVTRVAVVDHESPPAVAAAADLVVEGPVAALQLLERLAG